MAALLGLRGKSVATLLLACLLALIPAVLIGWKAIDDIHRHFTQAYAENYTLLHMQQIVAPVSRELALSRRLAASMATREWLADETDETLRARFFAEAEGFRRDFSGGTWFLVADASHHYYFDDGSGTDPRQPRYRLSPDTPNDAWYFHTLASPSDYNINVNLDHELGLTKVWFNVRIEDNGRVLGLTGTGLDLSGFLDDFIRNARPGLTPMIVDRRGALQAHPDDSLIALSSGATGQADSARTLQSQIDGDAQRDAVTAALHASRQNPSAIQSLWIDYDGRRQLLSVGYLPSLDWHVITALDISTAQVLERHWLWTLIVALTLILGTLLLAFAYATERLILTPLNRLKASAQAIANGDYRSQLPAPRDDEIGALSEAFSRMAHQVERYTRDLEGQVRERTRALEAAHAETAAAHKQLGDSIQYASIIQRAILPDGQLTQRLARRQGVLWKPRDTVGGDFYVFRADERGCLLGVVDCAGHGVPGAMMTMLAWAIIDHAIDQQGADDPAAILNAVDRRSRELLPAERLPGSIATNMDIALVWIDTREKTLTFSGAKLALYASNGERLEYLPGHRRALGYRHPTRYENQQAPLRPGWSYYLYSDGFLDQAGGHHGFGFGRPRFEALLRAQAHRSVEAQLAAFEKALDDYRGSLPQRDDITLLIFRAPEDEPDTDHPPQESPR